MKDLVYLLIRQATKKNNISGRYLGLAAAYTPEIFTCFHPYVKEEFVNCQIDHKDYLLLTEYQDYIENAYPYALHEVRFRTMYSDILKYMITTKNEYSIIDLDFMCVLSEKTIDKTIEGLDKCAADRSIVAIWHCSGRKITNKQVDEVYRPMLREKLQRKFSIVEDEQVNYFESYPMRVEILVLKRGKNARGDNSIRKAG